MENKNLPDDKMAYACYWCGHIWKMYSDKIATSEQVDTWFSNVQQEHMIVCKFYRILNGEKE